MADDEDQGAPDPVRDYFTASGRSLDDYVRVRDLVAAFKHMGQAGKAKGTVAGGDPQVAAKKTARKR